jgi:hypothetical protein
LMRERHFHVVGLNDWHVPFHDPAAVEAAFAFCEKLQPQIIVLHELHDFYALSRYDKDPSRISSLQNEIDEVYQLLLQLRGACPRAQMYLLKSNHQERLRKYLWTLAPALSSLRSLRVEELFSLSTLDIKYQEDLVWNGFLFKHGNIVRKDAGLTARAELAKEGVSGASGHTHRLAQVYRTKRGGKYTWIEGGCLCSLEPEYVEGTADWQQGFTLVRFKSMDSGHFYATTIPIIDGEAAWSI